MGVGAVKHCLKIRNQYVHCVWYDDKSGKLAFVNLEEIAKDNTRLKDLGSLTITARRCAAPDGPGAVFRLCRQTSCMDEL
jgi:hypothetical protein